MEMGGVQFAVKRGGSNISLHSENSSNVVQKLGGASAPSWIDLFEDAVKCPLAHNPLTDALCSIS